MSADSQATSALLGSHLIGAAKAHGILRPAPASSGSAVIDENALAGGFRYGEITSIAGISGTGKTLISYHSIASHLINHRLGEAALIDTTGSFSPLRLRDVLAFRLEARLQRERFRQSGYMYEQASSNDARAQEEITDRATSMLDRVKVMRVFDFAGVVEAVGEINEMLERTSKIFGRAGAANRRQTRGEVGDSEEDLDEDDDDRDPLLRRPSNGKPRADSDIGQLGMIIIDTITNVVSSLMSKSQVQGHALLASFMRSLHHLTSRHHICTILVNATVGINPSTNPEYHRRPEEHVSAFSSTLGKPALGKTFTYLIDTSILLSTIPRMSKDAVIACGDDSETSPFRTALVFEVLKDKRGSREGRWTVIEINAGIRFVPCPGR